MSKKAAIELGNVQKTLILPLWGRAFETKKEKPMLIDLTAVEIIENLDYDFSEIANNINELSQIAWIMRSICVDEVIKRFVAHNPKATIINIGCGLDTTFERVDNGSLYWYDLDLPDVIQLRKQFIQESERRKFISASFLEKDWLREIQVTENVIFIAAGVFYYFSENEVKDFLITLADNFPGSQVIFDVSSPFGVKIANKIVIEGSGLGERSYLTWGLDNVNEISTWDARFKILDTIFYFRKKNLPLSLKIRLLGNLSDFLKIQYMIHLETIPG